MTDLAALEAERNECLECSRCGLAKTRTKVVFGDGNPQAPLVIVGEGPGQEEDARGIPFVGRAGKLLDRVLLENALSRQWVYICNTVKCRACIIEGGRVRNRPPSNEEMDTCRPWLEQQLTLIRPAVILCLGSPASNTVIHKNFRITQERGQWYNDNPFAPWVMASWHPAYVLRQGGDSYERSRGELMRDIDLCRKKVIELRRSGELLSRQNADADEVHEPDLGPALFEVK